MLCQHNIPMAPAITRNIALAGMFIELEHSIFPKNSKLDVEFVSGDENNAHYYRAQVQVLRRTREGIGVKIENPTPKVRQAIRYLIEELED